MKSAKMRKKQGDGEVPEDKPLNASRFVMGGKKL
jgi:hypothetical protein